MGHGSALPIVVQTQERVVVGGFVEGQVVRWTQAGQVVTAVVTAVVSAQQGNRKQRRERR